VESGAEGFERMFDNVGVGSNNDCRACDVRSQLSYDGLDSATYLIADYGIPNGTTHDEAKDNPIRV
jgi:hypothetical protein